MFIAIRTFSASYTRRRMFFWSYWNINQIKMIECSNAQITIFSNYDSIPQCETNALQTNLNFNVKSSTQTQTHASKMQESYARTESVFGRAAENSATSSSATSLYVVRPFSCTFWHTFRLKCRSPFDSFPSRLGRRLHEQWIQVQTLTFSESEYEYKT